MVTHDQEEALAVSDEIVVMRNANHFFIVRMYAFYKS